jgi:hypothetical protein
VPQVRNLFLFDPTRAMRISSSPATPSNPDLSDRTYYTAQRDTPDLGLFVSEPFISRVTGDPTFVLSRRLAGDSFRGIAGAAVDVGYIRRFYQALDMGDGSAIELLRADGKVLVSREHSTIAAGPSPWLAGLVQLGPAAQRHMVLDYAPLGRTLVTMRQVPGYPAIVAVGRSEKGILAGWREKTWSNVLRTFVITSLAALLLVAFLRQDRLKVADFFPTARYFTAKSYPLDKNAKERLTALFGRPLSAAESRITVVTAYGKRAANDAAGPELVPQDPVSLDKLSPKEKIGYLVFVDLPTQGSEMMSYGVALGKDGSVTRVASETGLTKPAFDAAYQGFVGQGQKGQPGSLKPGKAPAASAQAFKNAYARILESIGLFDKEERDRHWAD